MNFDVGQPLGFGSENMHCQHLRMGLGRRLAPLSHTLSFLPLLLSPFSPSPLLHHLPHNLFRSSPSDLSSSTHPTRIMLSPVPASTLYKFCAVSHDA